MTDPNKHPASRVYVIGPRYAHPVKIGVSTNLAQRLQAIQIGNPNPLAVLWSTEGDTELEHALHARFAEYRRSGEWFDFGDRDPVAVIAAAVTTAGRPRVRRNQPQARHSTTTNPKGILVYARPMSTTLAELASVPPREAGTMPRNPLSTTAVRWATWYLRRLGIPLWWAGCGASAIYQYGPSIRAEYAKTIEPAIADVARVLMRATALQVIAAVAIFFAVRAVITDFAPLITAAGRRATARARRFLQPPPSA